MLRPGDIYSKEVIFMQEDVETFARITGDHNPIHTDSRYAAGTSFKKTIVHGMYAASAFSGVLGMDFPGKGSIAVHREISFIRPVFVDKLYTMHFRIIEINYEINQGIIKSTLKNDKGQVCIMGVSKIINTSAFPAGGGETTIE